MIVSNSENYNQQNFLKIVLRKKKLITTEKCQTFTFNDRGFQTFVTSSLYFGLVSQLGEIMHRLKDRLKNETKSAQCRATILNKKVNASLRVILLSCFSLHN